MTDRGGRRADLERAVVVREVELKVEVPEGFVLPVLLGAVPGVAALRSIPPAELVAAYHDTADLRLAAAGASLRRREGGPDAGWHLKLRAPAGQEGRDELRLPLGSGELGQVPEMLAAIVLPLVREAELTHRATVRTARTGVELLDADGEVLAELVDDLVRCEPSGSSFRQIEVEARVDDRRAGEVLDASLALLVAAGGRPTRLTKSAAALGVVDTPGPVPIPAVPRRRDAAGLLIAHVLATGVTGFLLADVDLRRGAPDAVHRMRVAARTLRSSLRTFAPLLQDDDAAAARRSGLGACASDWGAARDLEVQLERLLSAAALLPAAQAELAVAAVRDALRAREADALGDASAALHSEPHVALLVDLVEHAGRPPVTALAGEPIVEVVPGLLATALARLRHAAEELRVDGAAEQWHRVRVLAKRARYAAEAIAPVLPRARRTAARLATLTDLLGQVQDAAVGRALLAEVAASADGPTAYALGLLSAGQEEVERAARLAVLGAWPELDRVVRRPLVRA